MQCLSHVTKSLLTHAAFTSIVLAAVTISLRADSTCIGDCGQGASHLSDISGIEDVAAGASGFDIYFKPWLPIFLTGPSDLDSQSSNDSSSSGGWSDAGPLSFLGDGGSPGSNDGPPGPSDNTFSSPPSHLFNSPISGTKDTPTPTDPTPEPRYSALAMLGLGWAGLAASRIVRSRSRVATA